MSNDVEKNWHDPAAFRAAVTYVIIVVAIAGVALAFYLWVGDRSLVAASLVPLSLFIGGVGAFVKAYRVWRTEGTWPIWQGAGWFLLALFLLCLPVPATAL